MELFISGTLGEAKGRNAESRSAPMTQNGELGRPDADRRNLDGIYESSAIRCWRWSSSIFGEDPASKQSFLCRSGPASKKGVSKNNDYQATLARRVTGIKWGSGKNLARLAREERLAVNRVSSR